MEKGTGNKTAYLETKFENIKDTVADLKEDIKNLERNIFVKLDLYVSREVLRYEINALKEKDDDQQKQLRDLYGKTKWQGRILVTSLLSLIGSLILLYLGGK